MNFGINQLKCVRILRGIYKDYQNAEKGGGHFFWIILYDSQNFAWNLIWLSCQETKSGAIVGQTLKIVNLKKKRNPTNQAESLTIIGARDENRTRTGTSPEGF